MVFPLGCYGVLVGGPRAVLVVSVCCVDFKAIFVQVLPPCFKSQRCEVFAQSGRKRFYPDQQCKFIQSVNSVNVLHPSHSL